MGGIADYSGALVLQLPLDRATWVIAREQDSPHCEIASRRGGRWHRFSIATASLTSGELSEPAELARWFMDRPGDRWAAYVVGVLQWCLVRAAPRGPRGIRLLIDSTVPEGKGVSSSAAIEVATLAAVAARIGMSLPAAAVAEACQWVENHIVGAPCGIMDQMTSACGRADRLLQLRCQPGTIEGYVEVPAGFRFFGVDSGVRHAVTGADYGTVRAAAFMGYRMIAEMAGLPVDASVPRIQVSDARWNGYLANVSPEEFAARYELELPERMTGAEFLARYGGTTDPVTRVESDRVYPVRQATAHPVREQARVARFAELLGESPDADAAIELGRLMYGSHGSYGACGLGHAATDRLVELVSELGPARGFFGARVTGGGSGGTVAILAREDSEAMVRELAARYTTETGRPAEVFARSGPGAAESGVLEVDSQ
jgi:L-arabinokinase